MKEVIASIHALLASETDSDTLFRLRGALSSLTGPSEGEVLHQQQLDVYEWQVRLASEYAAGFLDGHSEGIKDASDMHKAMRAPEPACTGVQVN